MNNNRGTCYTCYTVHRWRWLPVGAFRAKAHSDVGYGEVAAFEAGLGFCEHFSMYQLIVE